MFSRQKPICQTISSVKTHLDCWSWEALLLLQLPSWGEYWWWSPAWTLDTGTAPSSFSAEGAQQPPLHSFFMKIRDWLSSKVTIKTMVRLWLSGTNGLLLPGHQFQWCLRRHWVKIGVLRHLTHDFWTQPGPHGWMSNHRKSHGWMSKHRKSHGIALGCSPMLSQKRKTGE